MKDLQSLLKSNAAFFLIYLSFLIAGICIVLFYSKAEGFYFLNPYHHNLLNYIFYFFTFLGDGFFIVALAVALLVLKKRKLSLLIISSYALSGIAAQALKYFIVEARPALYAPLHDYANFIRDVTLHNYQSFPSGHAASAFALASVIAFTLKNKRLGIILLFTAIFVGYSRIYIGQHFLIDVIAGSIIGVISGIICWLSLYKRTWLV